MQVLPRETATPSEQEGAACCSAGLGRRPGQVLRSLGEQLAVPALGVWVLRRVRQLGLALEPLGPAGLVDLGRMSADRVLDVQLLLEHLDRAVEVVGLVLSRYDGEALPQAQQAEHLLGAAAAEVRDLGSSALVAAGVVGGRVCCTIR